MIGGAQRWYARIRMEISSWVADLWRQQTSRRRREKRGERWRVRMLCADSYRGWCWCHLDVSNVLSSMLHSSAELACIGMVCWTHVMTSFNGPCECPLCTCTMLDMCHSMRDTVLVICEQRGALVMMVGARLGVWTCWWWWTCWRRATCPDDRWDKWLTPYRYDWLRWWMIGWLTPNERS